MTEPITPAQLRKNQPLATGVLDYFPDALLAVAECSRVGNEQHNPGEPLHWAKEKSTDEPDALMRHLVDRGTVDTDGVRHSAKVAWRALALLQREIEAENAGVLINLVDGEDLRRQTGSGGFDPNAQRPGENARQHRDRVNSPWPSQFDPLDGLPRGTQGVDPYDLQPTDFDRRTSKR